MSFWTENFNSDNNQIDVTKNIENELNEFIQKSFLEIYESLKPENPVKNFFIHLHVSKTGVAMQKETSCHDDYQNITISQDEEEDKNYGVFNSKIHSFSFELSNIIEKISIMTQKDFSIKLDFSSDDFIKQCNLYKDESQRKSSYFSNMSSQEIFNSFYNQLHLNIINFYCDLVSKYGKETYISISKDNNGNIKNEEIYPQDREDSIKNESSFKNLLQLSSSISNSVYYSYEELKRFSDRDANFKSYFYNNFNKAAAEFQKTQILVHIEKNEDEISNKRRL